MDEVQKCLSLANFLDLQSVVKKYECECYTKYLEEVKASNTKENDSIQQINEELESIQLKRSNLDRTKKLLVKSQAQLEQLKQDQEALIDFEEKKLQSIVAEGDKMLSHYTNKLAAMNKALQSSPQVAYALRLENQIAQSEFEIRKYNQQTDDLNKAIRRREDFIWQREKMAIVEFAQLMVEEKEHQQTMQEIQTEIERLTRETELAKLRTRREPALKPLKVYVAPEAISPPPLTPLMDLMQAEEIPSPCSMQTQDCTFTEVVEPPAKVPRRSTAPRFTQFSLRQKLLSLFSSPAAEERIDDNLKRNSEVMDTSHKRIKLLDEQVLSKSDVQAIIDTTQIVRLQKVEAIGAVRVGSETGLLQICNEDKMHTEGNEEVIPPSSAVAVTPPTQFQDAVGTAPAATETQEVLEDSLVNPTHDEASATVNGTCEIDLSNVEFTSLHLSDMSQAKEALEKKLNSSPDFMYTKKPEEKAVTSKFFANAEMSAEEGPNDAPRVQESAAVSAPVNMSMDISEDDVQAMDTAEGCGETAAIDDSLKQTATSELDESTYDFTSMLVTPSLLLSPRREQSCELDNQPVPSTSIFGGEQRAFLLPGAATDESAATEPSTPAPAPFFNFHEKKRGGFFSLFN